MSESRIIDNILEASNKEANDILKKAKQEAENIIKEAEEEIKKIEVENKIIAEKEAEHIIKNAQSSSEIDEKNQLLKARYEEIEKTIVKILEILNDIPEEKYFEFVKNMISRYRTGAKGEILFNDRDKKRLPEDLLSDYSELKISSEVANINGGFVLKYDDIFINCGFDRIIDEKKEDLIDLLNKELFA